MKLTLVVEREEDGRWICEVPELPGVLVYGGTQAEALTKSEVLAFRTLAERIEHAEVGPEATQVLRPAAV